jgi:hypothetical protein
MPTSYAISRINAGLREPLMGRIRSYYRGPRKSHQENLVSNKIYIDLQRIYLELEKTDIEISNNLKIFLDKEKDNNITSEKIDGSRVFSLDSDLIDSMSFHVEWKNEDYTEVTEMETVDTIAARLSKIKDKINRLEKNR